MRVIHLAIGFWLSGASMVLADGVHVKGTPAPLPGSRIEAVEGGRVAYIDLTGRRQERSFDEILSLSFDGFPQLDAAESRLATAFDDEGVRLLLVASLETDQMAQRRWILRRLVAVHDARNEYPEAIANLARLLAEDPHPAWLGILPVSAPAPSTPAAAAEALKQVQLARSRTTNGDVRAALEAMQASLQQMERSEGGDTTHSGFTVEVIRAPSSSTAGTSPAPEVPTGIASPEDIEKMLKRGEHLQALEACREAVRVQDRRSMAQLLEQAGRASHGLGQNKEAIIMFTRSGLLFPSAPTAASSLAAAAELTETQWSGGTSSRALWAEALLAAERSGDRAIEQRARKALARLDSEGG